MYTFHPKVMFERSNKVVIQENYQIRFPFFRITIGHYCQAVTIFSILVMNRHPLIIFPLNC